MAGLKKVGATLLMAVLLVLALLVASTVINSVNRVGERLHQLGAPYTAS